MKAEEQNRRVFITAGDVGNTLMSVISLLSEGLLL